jgi:hypothetical protein
VDTLKGCQDYLFAPYITEDRLPIIVNNVGGYTSFNPNDPNFVEIVECAKNEKPLTREQRYPKNSEAFEFGWIDLEGNTYACSHEGHWSSAECICKELGYDTYNGEYTLEKLHWIKVTRDFRGSNRKAYPGDGIYVTKKQADTLIELGLDKEDPMVEGFIHFSEYRW